TTYGPGAAVKPGVQLNVPLVLLELSGVNVAPGGKLLALSELIASPSGSAAVTGNDSAAFSATVRGAGAVTAGGRSSEVEVDALPVSALAAVNITVNGPAGPPALGVQLNVPLVCAPFEMNVAPGGSPDAVSDAMASRSASEAVTVKLSGTPTAALCEAGATTTGARSTFATEIDVLAEPLRTFAPVNVTV